MIDREQIYKWWSVFHEEGEITEIRSFGGKSNFSGYYKDVENAIRDIEYLESKQDLQVYFIINAIKDDCYGRVQRERLVSNAKTTSDSEIIGRKWLMVDLDPKRTAGISSSDEELELARKKANDVFKFLRNNGFNDPVVCMSGNGYHLMYPCRIAVSEETDKLVERFINALAMLFTDDKVDVDKQCKNKARLSKVYGTIAKKGSNSPERPWRTSRIIKVPDEIKPNDIEYIKKIADLYPEDKPTPSSDNNWGQGNFDVEAFLNKHGIAYKKESYGGDGIKYILDHCVFNEQHRGKDACIFQRNNGGLAYVCLHNSCSHYTWKDFRMKFEPNAYDRKEYDVFQHKQRYYGAMPVQPFKPKEENEEIGKKWLTPKDIKRKREQDIIAMPTGYSYLDKAIRGLILGEVTILSGLNGSGKSSWLNSVMLNIIHRGFKVACFSGELTDYNVVKWLAQSAAGKNYVQKVEGSEYAYEVNDKVYEKICDWLDGKFFLFNNNYGNKFEQVLSDLEEVVEKGVNFIVIDNLMALQINGFSGDRNEKQKQFILEVVEFAKKHNVHIVVVCHPRKESGAQTLLRKESIAGSSDLSNAVQNVMIVHRCGEDFCKRASEFFGKDKAERYMEYNNVVEVCKNRSYGVVDYLVGMFYEVETKRFKNYKAEHIVYGWQDEPQQVEMVREAEEYSYPIDDNPFRMMNNAEVPF